MPLVRTVIVSDLHLGASGAADVLRRPAIRDTLMEGVAGADEVVLLGDAIELRDRPLAEALEVARPFFEALGPACARVVVVPGNHDHHLLAAWLERRRLDGSGPLALEQRTGVEGGPLGELARWMPGTTIELAYPGLWLRPGMYATHGHYLDRHLTIPTFERLAVAAVERILGVREDDPLAPPPAPAPEASGPVGPDDYERSQAPLYAFLFTLAQGGGGGGGGRVAGANPSARVWQALGGGYGRAARMRGWLLGSVVVPGAVRVANRLRLGPVRPDLSAAAITRAGLEAIGEVARRLEIEAEHLIFGHTHRRGPGPGESGWVLPTGTRLWNTGSWVYAPGIAGTTPGRSPYWPGTIAVVEDDGPPELRHLLDEHDRSELTARAEPDA